MIKQFHLTNRLGPNRYYNSGQSGPGSNVNQGILKIPSRSMTGASLLDILLPYPGRGSYLPNG